MILDRRSLPSDAPAGMHALAARLVALAAAPGAGELPGQAAAVAAFAGSVSPASTLTLAGEPSGRRRRGLVAFSRARLAAAAAVAAVGLSGTAAAAYAGVLPASVQNFAHHVIDAPAAHHPAGHGNQPAGHQPGSASPPSAHGSAHPAKPGQHKSHKTRGQHSHRARHRNTPKPAHPTHPPRPTHSPRPAKVHPSPSPSPS
ncbi:MAG TPA: hypothetical protein VKB62_16490, partial [Streptosporangiaceae bacterium]|nr:hypothetical protein [Streptosporangiaceae bacterium]